MRSVDKPVPMGQRRQADVAPQMIAHLRQPQRNGMGIVRPSRRGADAALLRMWTIPCGIKKAPHAEEAALDPSAAVSKHACHPSSNRFADSDEADQGNGQLQQHRDPRLCKRRIKQSIPC
jgi:hypothetical protein